MAITPLPTPPSRSAPSTFSTLADAFLGALPLFVTESNAQAAALDLNDTTATSTTSLEITVASKSLTVDASKSYQPGMSVKIARTASPSNWMHGDVTSYNSGTGALVVNVTGILGSGTYTDWTVTFSAPMNPANNIVLGSDADGDTYHRAAGALARLAKGAANLKMFMNAGATAPEWAAGIKIVTFTRAMDAVSGDVAYTGAGFKPSFVAAIIGSDSGGYHDSIGLYDGSTNFVLTQYGADLSFGSASKMIILATNPGVAQQSAVGKTLDADGHTMTWTKTGTPAAATAYGCWIYFR